MIDLEKIRERWSRATPGPWESRLSDRSLAADPHDITSHAKRGYVASWVGKNDALAIAAAPTDVAALIQEVERMRAVVQGVRNMLAAEEDVETLLAEGADLDSEEVWHARDTLQGEALATYEALARLDANDE